MSTGESDRRSTNRCPTCQGPAVGDSAFPEGIRCRNSACKHNHRGVKCPRCSATDLAHVTFKNNVWSYTCSDCENTWTVPKI